ncbi:hypothetical protein AVEN_111686-1 [Araneus ventricosus]|uniref:TAFII-230 TBP-binding domain-containing protein n=1 Tax=Araneus ventricosus TaxID=182803 RepID=A0A4Y2Q9C6_ARAVE|nr:hypothetical protein AVEN_111686-1 [Araneus ventricosus]
MKTDEREEFGEGIQGEIDPEKKDNSRIMDSDEDGDNERVISLTHLLFGNIDDDGQLENDFLDPESIRHLDQLRQLGIGTQLKEITDDVDSPDLDQKDYNELEECTVKSPSAIDYSDITELADETDEMDVDKASISSESFKTKEEEENDAKRIGENCVDVKPSDSDLMPPPALPPPKDSNENLNDSNVSVGMYTNSEASNKEQENNNNTVLKASRVETTEKKLDTPLAAMLPSKYKNMDVTKLFPEFRHGQVCL